jgi:hypothetical protein
MFFAATNLSTKYAIKVNPRYIEPSAIKLILISSVKPKSFSG